MSRNIARASGALSGALIASTVAVVMAEAWHSRSPIVVRKVRTIEVPIVQPEAGSAEDANER